MAESPERNRWTAEYPISDATLLINCIGMYEGLDYTQSEDPLATKKQHQLISIRKKLAAPNNLLPKKHPRSQPPSHLLPLTHEHQAQPGQDMLLDDVTAGSRNQRRIGGTGRRCYSQMSQYHNPGLSFSLAQQDPLSFLKGSLRAILQNPSLITFVSKSAMATNLPTLQRRLTHITRTHSPQLIRQKILAWLQSSSHFGTTQYAHQLAPSVLFNSLPDFPSEDELVFSDDFEGSNLYTAMKQPQQVSLGPDQHQKVYLLTARMDYNTKSYGQWFYFRVARKATNTLARSSDRYRFKIINMTKRTSFFGEGLKVSVCRKGVWGKQGYRINYYPNSLSREENSVDNPNDHTFPQSNSPGPSYFTLQFGLQLCQGEEIHIAYNQPYTYARLGNLLDQLTLAHEAQFEKTLQLKRKAICKTPLNNNIEVLTLTAPSSLKDSNQSQQATEKPVIIMMARAHPAETAGSHVMEGIIRTIINCLQHPSPRSLLPALFKHYLVKIIPMVNPDGVILGNSRCNLSGYDLNRTWRNTQATQCPQVAAIKQHILQYQHRVSMFLDLHAHSKKKNVFAYGCHDRDDPFSTREFPYLLSTISPKDFLFSECRFSTVEQDRPVGRGGSKEGTARVFLYNLLKIPNVFTIENSYCSAGQSLFHYDTYKYQRVGSDILNAVALYFSTTYHSECTRHQYHHSSEDCGQTVPMFSSQISQRSKSSSTPPPINSPKFPSHADLRAKALNSLRGDGKNVDMGMGVDSEDESESEEEDRVPPLARQGPRREVESVMQTRREQTKTAAMRPTTTLSRKGHQTPNPRKGPQISNTSSEPQLTNNSKSITRLLRQSRGEAKTIDSKPQVYNSARQGPLYRKMTPLKSRLATHQDEVIDKVRRDNLLTVVDIWTHRTIEQPDLRSQLLQRVASGRSKAIHSYNEHRRAQEERSKQKTPLRISMEKETPEQDIREQMRRLIKPKSYLVTLGIREKIERKFKAQRPNKTQIFNFEQSASTFYPS